MRKKFTYQLQLTKFITKISSKYRSLGNGNTSRMLDVVILSHLIPTYSCASDFISRGLVSVNGLKVNNIDYNLIRGDVLSVYVTS